MDVEDIKLTGSIDRAKEFPQAFNLWKDMWISNFKDTSIENPLQGMVWFNEDTNKLRLYDKYGSWSNILTEADKTAINASISSLSTSTNTALVLKADLESPILTGIPKTPTATVGDSSTQIANTAFVTSAINKIPEITKTDSVNVESSTIVASATAVKTAYDKGVSAYNLASGKTTEAYVDGELASRDAVIETYTNGYNWYRKYASGWVEQGGYFTGNTSSTTTITLLTEMASTYYNIAVILAYDTLNDRNVSVANTISKTTTSFGAYKVNVTDCKFYWEVKGMGA